MCIRDRASATTRRIPYAWFIPVPLVHVAPAASNVVQCAPDRDVGINVSHNQASECHAHAMTIRAQATPAMPDDPAMPAVPTFAAPTFGTALASAFLAPATGFDAIERDLMDRLPPHLRAQARVREGRSGPVTAYTSRETPHISDGQDDDIFELRLGNDAATVVHADAHDSDAMDALWDRTTAWLADVEHGDPDALEARVSPLFPEEVDPAHATAVFVLAEGETDADTAWRQPAALIATDAPVPMPAVAATSEPAPAEDDDGDVLTFWCSAVTTGFMPAPAPGEACAGLTAAEKKVRMRDLTPAERELVRKAEAKEFASMRLFEVFEPVTLAQKATEQTQPCNILRLKFIYEWRVIDGVKGIKARLVAEGTKRRDVRVGVETSVALPHQRALRLLHTLTTQSLTTPWDAESSVLQGDLTTAFLQAPNLSPDVFVRLPNGFTHDDPLVQGMFSVDGIARARKALYGTKDAGAALDHKVRDVLSKLDFRESNVCPNVYYRVTAAGVPYAEFKKWRSQKSDPRCQAWAEDDDKQHALDAWVYAYVDDVQAGGGLTPARTVMGELRDGGLVFKEEPKKPDRFLGIFTEVTRDGIFWDQHLLALSLNVELKEGERLRGPLNTSTQEADTRKCIPTPEGLGDLCSPREHSQYRSLLGSFAYLQHTRPDLLYAISFFSRFNCAPTRQGLGLLKQACRYAKQTAYYGLMFPTREAQARGVANARDMWARPTNKEGSFGTVLGKQRPFLSQWHFDVVSDATWSTLDTMAGYFVLLNGAVQAMRSFKQRRVLNSSAKAELFALYDGVDVGVCMMALGHELQMGVGGDQQIECTAWTDALDVIRSLHAVNPATSEQATRAMIMTLQRILTARYNVRPAVQPLPTGTSVHIADPTDTHADEVRSDPYFPAYHGRWTQHWAPHLLEGSQPLARELRQYMVHLYAARDILNAYRIDVEHVAGEDNIADLLTKPAKVSSLLGKVMHDRAVFLGPTEHAQRRLHEDRQGVTMESEPPAAAPSPSSPRAVASLLACPAILVVPAHTPPRVPPNTPASVRALAAEHVHTPSPTTGPTTCPPTSTCTARSSPPSRRPSTTRLPAADAAAPSAGPSAEGHGVEGTATRPADRPAPAVRSPSATRRCGEDAAPAPAGRPSSPTNTAHSIITGFVHIAPEFVNNYIEDIAPVTVDRAKDLCQALESHSLAARLVVRAMGLPAAVAASRLKCLLRGRPRPPLGG